jgi:multidrug efflux pump subunit AcrB
VRRPRQGLAGAIARAFIDSRLTPLLIIASVLLGLLAILGLPREEEPQIKVPMVDVLVAMPGRAPRRWRAGSPPRSSG